MFNISVVSGHMCTKALNIQRCIKGGKNAEYPFWCFEKLVCSRGYRIGCVGVKLVAVKLQNCSGAAKVAELPRIQF